MVRRLVRDTGDTLKLVPAGLGALVLVAATVIAAGLSLVGVGVPVLDVVLAATRHRAGKRRRRLEILAHPYPTLPSRMLPRLRLLLSTDATWRDLCWQAAGTVLLPVAATAILLWVAAFAGMAAPLLVLWPSHTTLQLNGQNVSDMSTAWLVAFQGVLLAAAAGLLQSGLVAVDRTVSRALLRPTVRAVLVGQVAQLTESRADAVDTLAMELRRIERDLHDGAQAHLVALSMTLGLAEQKLPDDEARRLVTEARASAATAMERLREIVRGIHPPVLAERGLAYGVEELALAAALPVTLRIDLPARLSAPVESALYFTVAELLTNAGRHGAAAGAVVELRQTGDDVRLTVRDDGRGGAVARPGSGLDGLRRRLGAFGGRLSINSPAGGPTVIDAVVPCGW